MRAIYYIKGHRGKNEGVFIPLRYVLFPPGGFKGKREFLHNGVKLNRPHESEAAVTTIPHPDRNSVKFSLRRIDVRIAG